MSETYREMAERYWRADVAAGRKVSTLRLEQIHEALADLETVFADPSTFGDCTVGDCCQSLASEFVGAYRDAEIVRRLDALAAADQAGKPKDARRHLLFVRRAIERKWKMPAQDATKVLVAAA